MKISISFLLILIVIVRIFSLEAVLIDFNNLNGTMIDFSEFSKSTNWNEEVKEEMKVDLSPDRWTIKVNSSSWTKESKDKSYVFPIIHSQHFPDKIVFLIFPLSSVYQLEFFSQKGMLILMLLLNLLLRYQHIMMIKKIHQVWEIYF